MDRTDGNKIRAVFFVILLKIRNVLEIVGIQRSFGNTRVRCNGIFEFYDLQCDAFFSKDRFGDLEDLGVRCDVRAYFDDRVLFLVGLSLLLAACCGS